MRPIQAKHAMVAHPEQNPFLAPTSCRTHTSRSCLDPVHWVNCLESLDDSHETNGDDSSGAKSTKRRRNVETKKVRRCRVPTAFALCRSNFWLWRRSVVSVEPLLKHPQEWHTYVALQCEYAGAAAAVRGTRKPDSASTEGASRWGRAFVIFLGRSVCKVWDDGRSQIAPGS